ncbi:hypothetical protein B0H63DRAFT_474108 [Podospora didyma]|uniref:Uncharacterized protein n=1 Tax=Podospora didyma TaxID=330526 RepID=A0AAE0NQW7_9PEZI|nr:hypothetical protein B0H63DRAFT_474108 [Podospora didyma]
MAQQRQQRPDPPITDPRIFPEDTAGFEVTITYSPSELVPAEGLPQDTLEYIYRVRNKDSTDIKYLILHTGINTLPEEGGFGIAFRWPFAFSHLPDGDWNMAFLERNADNMLEVGRLLKRRIPGIEGPCPAYIPRAGFTLGFIRRPLDPTLPQFEGWYHPAIPHHLVDKIPPQEVMGLFGAEKVLLMQDSTLRPRRLLPQKDLRHVARIYAAIHDQGNDVAPRLVSYLVENKGQFSERIVGLAIELLPNVRFATPDDIDECSEVLEALHDMGIVYGPRLRRKSFLIVQEHPGGPRRALLQDFYEAAFSEDDMVKEVEMEWLPQALRDDNSAFPQTPGRAMVQPQILDPRLVPRGRR